jgi:hypothetical protein
MFFPVLLTSLWNHKKVRLIVKEVVMVVSQKCSLERSEGRGNNMLEVAAI